MINLEKIKKEKCQSSPLLPPFLREPAPAGTMQEQYFHTQKGSQINLYYRFIQY